MLVPIERLIGTPILSLQTGLELARTDEPIIDPRQLKLVAFRVTDRHRTQADTVLHPDDIREISTIGIIIDSSDKLMTTEGLVRLQTVIDFGFTLPGVRVEDDLGTKLGTVKGYAVDPDSFYVQQLYLKPPLLRAFATTHLTIRRSQIASITNQLIVVKSPTVKNDESLTTAVKSTFANPFRAPTPTQPESKNC